VPDSAVDRRARTSGAGPAARVRGAGYVVYDPVGQKIGRAEEVFANWDGELGYIRIRLGFFGMKSVLIPVQFVETDEK
jgi:PRC-barrel domain